MPAKNRLFPVDRISSTGKRSRRRARGHRIAGWLFVAAGVTLLILLQSYSAPARVEHDPVSSSYKVPGETQLLNTTVQATNRYTVEVVRTGQIDDISINNNSKIVGTGVNGTFIWEARQTTRIGTWSAMDINDSDWIIGFNGTLPNFWPYAVRWAGVGAILQTLIPAESLQSQFCPCGSYAYAVNGSNQIVGSYATGSPQTANRKRHPFLLQNGVVTDLYPDTAIDNGYALAVNDLGHAAGYVTASSAQRAFVSDGAPHLLQNLPGGGTSAKAYDISDPTTSREMVVGTATDFAGQTHFVLWNRTIDPNPPTPTPTPPAQWEAVPATDLGECSAPATCRGIRVNKAGQIVSPEGLYENGQWTPWTDLLPEGTQWGTFMPLDINNNGAVVGDLLRADNSHVGVLLRPTRRPVLIIPGIGGTFASNLVNELPWLLNRGVPPADITVDPLAHVYDDLIKTLENVGYVQGQDLFVVNYDWRLMPGPVDHVNDGHINGLSAAGISDTSYEYGVDYLGWYLKQAAEAWANDHAGEYPDSVDVSRA